MADYPSSVKNFSVLYDGTDKVIAAHPNDRGGEITAIETLIGAFGTGQGNVTSLKTLLADFIRRCLVEYKSAGDIYVRMGEIAIPNVAGDIRWRRNISDLTVNWANLDTGAEASSTVYYVYACADNNGTTFTVKISTDSAAPTGMTFYRKLGSFYNNASNDVDKETIIRSQNTVFLTSVVAHGGTIALPEGFSENQCKWLAAGVVNANTSGSYGWDEMEYGISSGRIVKARTMDGETSVWNEGSCNCMIIGMK